MQRINLSQNKSVLLDDEDFARLSRLHWCYRGERNGGPGYAIAHVRDGKKYKTVYLHREVMGLVPPGHEVVFLNGDRLDCRRANLLVVTKLQARRHHLRARSDSQSGIKGIKFNRGANTWSVDIYRDGRSKRVGTFFTRKEAMDAYQERLRRENPVLFTAPDVVENRPVHAGPAQRGNPPEGGR
jgi:hypothetical protein